MRAGEAHTCVGWSRCSRAVSGQTYSDSTSVLDRTTPETTPRRRLTPMCGKSLCRDFFYLSACVLHSPRRRLGSTLLAVHSMLIARASGEVVPLPLKRSAREKREKKSNLKADVVWRKGGGRKPCGTARRHHSFAFFLRWSLSAGSTRPLHTSSQLPFRTVPPLSWKDFIIARRWSSVAFL